MYQDFSYENQSNKKKFKISVHLLPLLIILLLLFRFEKLIF
jgi:hypothetical protein